MHYLSNNIFFTTLIKLVLRSIFSTWSSFKDMIKLSLIAWELIISIKVFAIKLITWVKQAIEFSFLFHRKSRRFIALFNSFFNVLLLLALSIITSKSFFLISKKFKSFINSVNNCAFSCTTSSVENSISCSWYSKLKLIQYIKTSK